jgi:leucyl/phenylalanyl-tRNA--protein transferase
MQPPTECRWQFLPHSEWPPDEEVVAIGADLEPDTVLYAYAHGMFPMYVDKKSRMLGWWSPFERGVIPLNGFHISRSMRNSAQHFVCTINVAFVRVMQECATARTDGNWINQEFIDAYTVLHEMGHAHSVEVWNKKGELVGGLYGLRINGFFAGESMFHRETDASKVALMHLVDLMNLDGMQLLDTQWNTDHLASLGCTSVPRPEYLALLAKAIVPQPFS